MKKFERRLGLSSVISISIASMLGSGIFVLPGIAYHHAGSYLWLAYILSAVCIFPAAVSKSELATAMPTSGGTYIYLERTFGPLAGTVAGFGLNLSLLLKAAFALVGFGAYLSVLTKIPLKLTALALLFLILVINILGVGKVSSILVVIVLTSLFGLVALVGVTSYQMPFPEINFFEALGRPGLFAATALVFVSYAGVTKVAAIAEEIKSPDKNLPRGILYSLGIVSLIYAAVNFVMGNFLTAEQLNYNLKPIHTLAEAAAGPAVGLIAAGLAILTMTSMANAGILAASRFPFAMSRDRLLPNFFGRIHHRLLTPVWSILFSGVIVAISIMVFDVEKIAKLASAFMILIYMSENLAVIVLRENRVQWYKPSYQSPFYPWVQIFGIISCMVLLFAMGSLVITAILSICIPGLTIYLFFSRKRTVRRGVIGIRGQRLDLVDHDVVTNNSLSFSVEDIKDEKASSVVALFGNERSPEDLIEVGVALANRKGIIEAVHLTEIPEQTELGDVAEETSLIRALRRRSQQMSNKLNANIVFDSIVSHDIYKSITEITKGLNCQWLVTEWGGRHREAFTLHDPMGWLRDHLSCHLATFKDSGVRYVSKILVLIKTHRNNDFLLETCDHLAEVHNANITLMSYVGESPSEIIVESEKQILKKLCDRCPSANDFLVLTGKNKIKTLVQETSEFDLLVFEADRGMSRFKRLFGLEYDRLTAESACSVISIQPSREVFQVRSAQEL